MNHLSVLLERYPALSVCEESIRAACEAIIACYTAGGKLLMCGNGGSCADSDHIAGECLKGFLKKRELSAQEKSKWQEAYGEEGAWVADTLQGGFCAINLPGFAAPISAVCNDTDPQLMYAQLVWAMGKPGDVLIGLSTSGGAKNVKYAAQAAKQKGMLVISLTGQKNSPLSELADAAIRVPAQETYQVQEYHLPVYHWLCAALEDVLFPD